MNIDTGVVTEIVFVIFLIAVFIEGIFILYPKFNEPKYDTAKNANLVFISGPVLWDMAMNFFLLA